MIGRLRHVSHLRRVIGRVLGVHPKRSLPAFAAPLERDFAESDRFAPRAGADGRPCVALFGDCFTLYNEPGIGRAARTLLEACGYRVLLPAVTVQDAIDSMLGMVVDRR